jgi:hypothetical protein
MSAGEHGSFEVRQDPDHIARRKIMAITVASIILMLVSLVVAWALLRLWGTRAPGPAAGAPRTIGTLEQTLIIDTKRGLDLRSQQEADLQRWGWADRDAGIARIPIDRAMELVVARPIPADRPFSPKPSSTTGAPERPPEGLEVAP